jgi:hypothetical protein
MVQLLCLVPPEVHQPSTPFSTTYLRLQNQTNVPYANVDLLIQHIHYPDNFSGHARGCICSYQRASSILAYFLSNLPNLLLSGALPPDPTIHVHWPKRPVQTATAGDPTINPIVIVGAAFTTRLSLPFVDLWKARTQTRSTAALPTSNPQIARPPDLQHC